MAFAKHVSILIRLLHFNPNIHLKFSLNIIVTNVMSVNIGRWWRRRNQLISWKKWMISIDVSLEAYNFSIRRQKNIVTYNAYF